MRVPTNAKPIGPANANSNANKPTCFPTDGHPSLHTNLQTRLSLHTAAAHAKIKPPCKSKAANPPWHCHPGPLATPPNDKTLHQLVHLTNAQTCFGPGPNLQPRHLFVATLVLSPHPSSSCGKTLRQLLRQINVRRRPQPARKSACAFDLCVTPPHEKPTLQHLHATLSPNHKSLHHLVH